MNKQLEKNTKFILFMLASISALLYVTYKLWTPIEPEAYKAILIYLFLLIFVNSFPLKIGDIYISFIMAISISVFLEYGLIVEAWLTQASILISMLVTDQRRKLTRVFLTMMMFIWISIIAGGVYFLAGGKTGIEISTIGNQMFPILLYTISYFLVNHFMLYFIRRNIDNTKVKLFTEDIAWDATTLLLTLPLGVILYLVKISYGIYGMLFVAVPIMIVTLLFKVYSELHHSHKQLKGLNRIASSFTSELNIERTIVSLQSAIRELLNFDYSYILMLDGKTLNVVSIEDNNGNIIKSDQYENFKISLGEGLSGRVALNKKAEMIGSDADLFQLEVEPEYIKNNKSLLSVPMIWHNQVIGVITLGSSVEYHFSKRDLTIAKILASQAAIAIQNATKYQKTEERSMLDELTGLYNYRAFDELLKEMILKADMKEEQLSLLIIDLDFFKIVNDTYGHDVGNIVLQEVAKILKEYTRKEDIVARYGGEEFTIILPGANCEKAETIAERIRVAIQNNTIRVRYNLNTNEIGDINVTASLGVATYPDMSESAQDLVRNADRAMYIGSKQSGRNKVSIYQAS